MRRKCWSCGGSGCTIVLFVLHCHFSENKHPKPSNSSERSLLQSSNPFCIFVDSNNHNSWLQGLHLIFWEIFRLCVIFRPSNIQLLDILQTLTSLDSDLQLGFSWKFLCSKLFFQNQCFVLRHINFSLWSFTLELILAYPIELLIPCYHQNLRGIV